MLALLVSSMANAADNFLKAPLCLRAGGGWRS